MKPDRWQQLDSLFHSALEHAPEERAAFLDEACAGDQQLRKEVEALIAASEQAGSFIEKPALEREARSLADKQGNAGAESMVERTIGHYRLIALLGSGGMGEVYLAQDNVLGRKVALKLLPAFFTKDTERLRRFEQEARAASALNHPNIVTIHEIGNDGSFHFIAQEFVEGATLRSYRGGKRLAFDEALEISMQVASALAAAHAKGIVHRDIKPENIMVHEGTHLGRQNYVKVLDFGIAKLADVPGLAIKAEATTRVLVRTEEGRAIGTAVYMSPEQARGEGVDARTDIWSLGVVLYEMLTGKQPFGGDTSQDVIASILRDDLPPLPSEFPEAWRWILKKALRKDQADRYQTARELFSDLRELHEQLQEVQSSVGRSVSPTPDIELVGQTGAASSQEPVATTKEIPARPTSTAEYIAGGFKGLGWGAIVVVTALLVAGAGITYGLYKLIGQKQNQISQNQTRPAFPFQKMKISRLTSTGKAADAAISPDGKYVVHVVDDGNQQSLWLRQVLTSSNVQIIPPANISYFGLTFSPGADYLYYIAWDRTHINPLTLYQMPALGGTAKKLIVDIDSVVTFSPDGKEFAFVRGYPSKGVVSVLVANADGTAERPIATRKIAAGPFGDPAWSPDGKVIAYPVESTDANGWTLFEVQVADGSVKPISSQRWWQVGHVMWLRDGAGLMFIARESVASPSQIWYLSYPGGEAHRITNDLNDYVGLSLAADSAVLVTVQSEQVSNIWIAPSDDARPASQITHSKFDGVDGIAWTPSGEIVYASGASGKLDLWTTEANGTGQKQLTADAGNNSSPTVSSDGRYVVFISDRTGTDHVWRIDIDGSNARQLTNGSVERTPQCAPAGQWVLYQSNEPGVWKVPIDGGETVRVIAKDSGSFLSISPDGKWIATAHYEPTAVKTAIYPIEGGEPHKILDIAGFYVRWTPDGRALAYLDEKDLSSINTQPIDGGPPKQLVDFKPDKIFSFAWARDGKQLALARGTVNFDVVLITDFKTPQ
jgi:serine/threonine protein kinase/Tol biopolymer transport system component